MAGTILNPLPVPLVDENRRITRGWLYALLAMSKTLVSSTVTGPASSTTGALATYADTTGTLLSQLTGTGLVKIAANVASVLAFPVDATKFLNGTGVFTTPAGSVVLQGTTQVLTNAQIKTLPSVQIDLVAAQGAGTRILPLWLDLHLSLAAGGDYTAIDADGFLSASLESGETGFLSYIANDSTIALTNLTTFLTGAPVMRDVRLLPWTYAEPVNQWGNLPTIDTVTAASLNDRFLLYVVNAAGTNFTGGNAANTLTVTPYYTVLGY